MSLEQHTIRWSSWVAKAVTVTVVVVSKLQLPLLVAWRNRESLLSPSALMAEGVRNVLAAVSVLVGIEL